MYVTIFHEFCECSRKIVPNSWVEQLNLKGFYRSRIDLNPKILKSGIKLEFLLLSTGSQIFQNFKHFGIFEHFEFRATLPYAIYRLPWSQWSFAL